jgi:heterodisulfide reductase subunit C/quinone-modifying oxidoreductase subunit QmoC
MYTLKRIAVREHMSDEGDAPDWSQSFIGFVESYGRSFEFGLATRYHLTHRPLTKVGVGPLALELFSKHRMSLRPDRIHGMDQLRAVLDRARELEAV